MSQPPAYVKATDFSQDELDNVGGRTEVRADRVDAEFEGVQASIAGIRTNLALLQRDDGGVRDGIVGLHTLSAAARIALQLDFNPMGLWVTATAYAVNDMVDVAGTSYLCSEAHTSGVFATDYAAGKWQVVAGAETAAGVEFTPPTSMESTDVQAAIQEVQARAVAATPVVAALYGAF